MLGRRRRRALTCAPRAPILTIRSWLSLAVAQNSCPLGNHNPGNLPHQKRKQHHQHRQPPNQQPLAAPNSRPSIDRHVNAYIHLRAVHLQPVGDHELLPRLGLDAGADGVGVPEEAGVEEGDGLVGDLEPGGEAGAVELAEERGGEGEGEAGGRVEHIGRAEGGSEGVQWREGREWEVARSVQSWLER